MGPTAILARGDTAQTGAAVVIGVTAAFGAAVLLQLRPVMLALVMGGLLVFCGSFVARDPRRYWFSVFLLSVPLSIAKLFFWSPEDVTLIKAQAGVYINENMVPQLYVADLPLAMLFMFWLGDLVARRRRIEVPHGFVLIAAFWIWALLTVIQERFPLFGAVWLIYEAKLILMFVWFVNARLDRTDLRQAVGILLLSLSLQSAVTMYTYVRQTGENVFGSLFGVRQSAQEERLGPARGSGAGFVFEQGSRRRGTGTIGTANLEAKYFVLILPLALVAAVAPRRPIARVAGAVVLVAGVAALGLTFSRGGLLSAAAALAVVPVLFARMGVWSGKSVVRAVVAGLAALAVASPWLLRFLGSRPGYGRTRLDQLWYGLEIWWRNPIAGVGMNNFNMNVPPMAYDGTFNGSPIHNHYLRVAIETGLLGAVLYFGFFFWALRLSYRLTRASDQFVAMTGVAIFAGLFGNAIYWSEDLFYDPIIRMQTWILIGMAAALARLAASESGETVMSMLTRTPVPRQVAA